jgi:hypothetical protein
MPQALGVTIGEVINGSTASSQQQTQQQQQKKRSGWGCEDWSSYNATTSRYRFPTLA